MAAPLNANVRVVEVVGRQSHLDGDGGGRIVRIIYCEPYTAHKWVETALKGTVYTTGGGIYKRLHPHSDPLKPWFYCNDTQVVEFNKRTARGMAGSTFNPALDPDPNLFQIPEIQRALSQIDDFDGSSFIDNLVPAEIATGTLNYGADNKTYTLNTGEVIPINNFASRGQAGCFIVATYVPLIFQQGLPYSGGAGGFTVDPFDYVDPQWEAVTMNTQVGRHLYFFSPTRQQGASPDNHYGLLDTYAKPEVVWRFSIRRLMVPFLPDITINLFSNMLNSPGGFNDTTNTSLGSTYMQRGCWRMETPEVTMKRAPDGQTYYDLRLKFLVRKLYDEFYDPQAQGVQGGPFRKGFVGWNWAYGIPSRAVEDLLTPGLQRSCYYPVVWNSGLFQYFGTNHPLFLACQDVDMTLIANGGALTKSMAGAPFQTGFQTGQ